MKYGLASSTWDEREYEAISRVVKSGRFTMGDEVKALEKAFAARIGSKYCVMVNSGSSANLLMVASMAHRSERPLTRGDEVIVPAVSWATTYSPLHQYGLTQVFVDIDGQTLNMDLGALEAAITDRTRAVLCVNLLGNPNNFDQLIDICQRHDLVLLEDNCESLGARWGGREAGSFGLIGTFSSFYSHHIATMEGGYLCTDDEELYHIALSLRAHGWTRDLPSENRVTGTKSSDPFDESYNFVLPGYNLRPLEIEAALAVEQLKKLDMIVRIRRLNADKFQEVMVGHPHFRIQTECGESSWFGFSLVLEPDAPWGRTAVVAHLAAAGIESRPIVAGNFANKPALRWMRHRVSGRLANAEHVDRAGLFVGNHAIHLEDELELLDDALTALVG